jgi:hypothetical protein
MTLEFEDEVENLSRVSGGKGKKGDIAVYVDGDKSKCIIIEAKDSSAYVGSKPKVENELTESMHNRNAKFGVFLFRKQSQMPSGFSPVKIMKDRIICSSENHGLYFAYKLARHMIQSRFAAASSEMPLEEIQEIVKSMLHDAEEFDQIRTKAGTIKTSAEYIETHIATAYQRIQEGLTKIERMLSSKPNNHA